jgi:hypothetical protein
LLAPVLLELIPKDTLVIRTTQEELRRMAGIGDRRTAKKALTQLEETGLVATAREATDREPRSGRFTTVLCVRLTWASPSFQGWLARTPATQSKCGKLHTVKLDKRHEITHGGGVTDELHEVPFDSPSLEAFGQAVRHFAVECGGDFERVLESTVAYARRFNLPMPSDAEALVRRIVDAGG